jgi:Skp family chaperone for outer membrane proteins
MLNRGSKLVFLSFIVAFLLASPGYSQEAPRIAAIDLQRTFEQSAEGKNVISKLKQKEQAILGELDKYDKQILSLETKLKTQRLTLAEETQQKLAFDLDTAGTQRKRVEEDSTKDFQRLQFTLVTNLKTEILAVVESYAKEKQISLVFDLSSAAGVVAGGVVYCEPTLDITSEIIKRYDAAKAVGK